MNKTKKFLCMAMSAVMALGMVVLAACDNDKPDPNLNPDTKPPVEKVIPSLEFNGYYDELASFGFNFDFYAELSEGKGKIYTKENKDYSEKELFYTCEEDKDGIVTLEIKMKGDTSAQDPIYMESSGLFTWSYTFTFAGSYSRTVVLSGFKLDNVPSGCTKYGSLDAWKKAVEAKQPETPDQPDKPDEPVNEAEATYYGEKVTIKTPAEGKEAGAVLPNCSAALYLYKDGTCKAADGYAAGGKVAHEYTSRKGTYTKNADGSITITLESDANFPNGSVYTVKDGKVTIEFKNDEGIVHSELTLK